MTLKHAKFLLSFFWNWVLSFFTVRTLRKNVYVLSSTDKGMTVEPEKSREEKDGIVAYRPYCIPYYFVGFDFRKGSNGDVVYRFYDNQTKKEFLLTKELVDLLFYKEPGHKEDAMVNIQNRETT